MIKAQNPKHYGKKVRFEHLIFSFLIYFGFRHSDLPEHDFSFRHQLTGKSIYKKNLFIIID
jgi:hypothetical protein